MKPETIFRGGAYLRRLTHPTRAKSTGEIGARLFSRFSKVFPGNLLSIVENPSPDFLGAEDIVIRQRSKTLYSARLSLAVNHEKTPWQEETWHSGTILHFYDIDQALNESIFDIISSGDQERFRAIYNVPSLAAHGGVVLHRSLFTSPEDEAFWVAARDVDVLNRLYSELQFDKEIVDILI